MTGAHHRNQHNKAKLRIYIAMYKPLLFFYELFKQLYISNKMERFSYKGGHDICALRHLKKRWLGL